MCSVVDSQVLAQLNADDAGFHKYSMAIHLEWLTFWQDVRDLDITRWDLLTLSYDALTEMPWIIFADACSAIRDCSKLELMIHNTSESLSTSMTLLERPTIEDDELGVEPRLPDELAVIIDAALRFRESFSHSLLVSCRSILNEELWQDPASSLPIRIKTFYERANFAEEISDLSFNDLVSKLETIGGFEGLETASFLSILRELPQSLSPDAFDLKSTRFRLKVIVKGALEMTALYSRLLEDLLFLLVFIEMDIDREESPMENLDATEVYVAITGQLQRYQLIQWVASNVRLDPGTGTIGPSAQTGVANEIQSNSAVMRTSTVLENLFSVDLKPPFTARQSQCTSLNQSIQDLLRWVMGGDDRSIGIQDAPVYIQCNLLAQNNVELASNFVRFQPSTAWSTYIRGRLSLAQRQFAEAAMFFKKAAFKLGKAFDALILAFPWFVAYIPYSSSYEFGLFECLTRASLGIGSFAIRERTTNLLQTHFSALLQNVARITLSGIVLRPPGFAVFATHFHTTLKYH